MSPTVIFWFLLKGRKFQMISQFEGIHADPSGLPELKKWNLKFRDFKSSLEIKRAIHRTSGIYIRSLENPSAYLSVHMCEGTTKVRKRTTHRIEQKIPKLIQDLGVLPLSPPRIENLIFHRAFGDPKCFPSWVGPNNFYTKHCFSNTGWKQTPKDKTIPKECSHIPE